MLPEQRIVVLETLKTLNVSYETVVHADREDHTRRPVFWTLRSHLRRFPVFPDLTFAPPTFSMFLVTPRLDAHPCTSRRST